MSRHRSLAGGMQALLAYRSRPEGEIVPVQSNWSVVAVNDNEPIEMGHERIRLVTPSVDEIMRNVAKNDIERNAEGQVIRIGRLRFSNGKQVERGYKRGPEGDAVGTEIKMPAGALLGSTDRQHTQAGADDNPSEITASNNYFYEMFDVARSRRKPARRKDKRNGVGASHEEAKKELAEAYANTPVLPPIQKCPPGLPSAGNRIADSFLGMKKAASGDSGAQGWEDICSALVGREIWAQAIADLSDRDRLALDAVAHGRATSYASLGVSLGQSQMYADKKSGGRKALRRANDNLQINLSRMAA